MKKKLAKELNYLECTPVRNYEHQVKEDGLIDVLVPRFKSDWLSKFLMPKKRSIFIRANLDELGTAVWQLIDGNNKVDFISEKLSEKFGENIQPVNDRLILFLTQLYRNGFIKFKELERN